VKKKAPFQPCFEKKQNAMKKIIITYGLIGGVIVAVIMVTTQPLLEKGIINFDNGMLVGYASMVIALSMVFFGIKTYRDQHLNGTITFWNAFKVGILITAIACLMYAITWEFYYNLAAPDFTQKYTEHYLTKMAAEGASTSEIEAMKKEMADFNVMYQNPLIRFAITVTEILPVGLIITLISAALLRKKEIFPASPAV
jgi:hypothetical protein